MALPLEQLSHIPGNLPLGAEVMGAGIDLKPLLALGAAATGIAAVRRVTPLLHETVNINEVGVLLRSGHPIEKKVVSQKLYDIHTKVPNFLMERQNRYFPGLERYVTKEMIEAGYGRYITLPSNWYLTKGFLKIEPVSVADHPATIAFPFEANDGGYRKQIEVKGKVQWKVSPRGDNPIHAIKEIEYDIRNKKDNEKDDKDRRQKNDDVKTALVEGQTAPGLSRALAELDLSVEEMYDLVQTKPEVACRVGQAAIEYSKELLSPYGIVISSLTLIPIHRSGEEVTGDSFGKNRMPPETAAAAAATRQAKRVKLESPEDEDNVINGRFPPLPPAA